ncbi:nuclear transport factor 2 family protein [Actinomycetospora termitidis]|uniref:Nuclear transport factor 2 family protein n=1 Tax=Actinomycetospora termitidis TaxID=3053470 RepID=A0ABT7MAH5_9PSEU|nr:nuclear transport factor 2 family protein [Actinomycetospora sp. Odt1-22]MDL5156418.1 nuclear transport factor 2 family protein [Actinomycetospora sp. Odt1-22]
MSTTTTVAQRVLEALAATDTPEPPDDLFAPGAITWHSFDELEAPTVPGTFDTLRAIRAAVPDFTMSGIRATGDGERTGIARYVLTGTLPDGSTLRAPAAMVIDVQDGRAARLEEYVDTGQLAPLFAALG